MTLFEREVMVSFGDCDPAGIVYYPNYFRWMDATFHAFLLDRDEGHAAICKRLGSRGLGLMDSRLSFRSPAIDGDRLLYAIHDIDWSARSFGLTYTAHIGERLVLEGTERRGIFIDDGERLRAGQTAPLRALIG